MEEKSYKLYSPIQLLKIPSLGVAFTGEIVDYSIYVTNVTESDDVGWNEYYVTTYDSLLVPSPLPLDYNGTGAPVTSGVMGPGEMLTTTISREVLPSDPEFLINVLAAEFYNVENTAIIYTTTTKAEVVTSNPLKLTKTPSSKKASAGETIPYDYTITNISP